MNHTEEINRLHQKVIAAINENGDYVNALGHLRYTALMRLTFSEIQKLHDEYLESGVSFEKQIDLLILQQQ